MLPRWHILLGAILAAILWIVVPQIGWFNIALVFLASFLIDFDHYICAAIKNKSLSLPKALRYYDRMQIIEKREHDKGIRRRGDFHLFHTIEFHVFVALLGFLWTGFFYIFAGMAFHSMTDLVSITCEDRLYRREYLLSAWLARRFKTNK